jgi:hypothetical protein
VKRKINISGESYTHKILWHTTKHQIEAAKQFLNESDFFHLTAMMMTFFTLEAYLNYLGDIIDPGTWKNENEFFSKRPYIGTIGKLDFLIEKCGMSKYDRGKRPFQTLKKLKRIRDFLAHGKPEKIKTRVKYSEGKFPDYVKSYLGKNISEKEANRALEDTEKVINELHMAAKAKFPSKNLSQQPLNGSLGFQISEAI